MLHIAACRFMLFFMTSYRGKHNHWLRRTGERLLDSLLLDGLLARWSYLFGLQGQLQVVRYQITLPQNKRLPRPLRIAFASDFHAGPTTHPAIFSELFNAIDREKPDILLMGGDFVSCNANYLRSFSYRLSECNPPLGKFAVLGNHDLWTDDQLLSRILHDAGVNVLINQNTSLPAPFDNLSICGLDDPWTGDADSTSAFVDTKPVRILLMHAPDGLLLLQDEQFDLCFAGHTHGGQIALKDGTPIIVPHGPLCRKFHRGKFDIDHNGSMIVSSGVGCSTLPIRINVNPELVICHLG